MEELKPEKKKRGRPKRSKQDIIDSIKGANIEVKPVEKKEDPVDLPNIEHESVSISVSDNAYEEAGYDPWESIIEKNSDKNKYYHRALNIKPSNLSKKKYMGYEIVPGQSGPIGDLILARLPIDKRKQRIRMKEDKTRRVTKAVKENFQEEVRRAGLESFDEGR